MFFKTMDFTAIRYAWTVCLLILARKVQCACPDGFTSHQQSCYKEFPIRASWDEAQTYCKAYGAHMASVEDDIEEQFLHGLIHGHAQGFFSSEIFWLDGTDQQTEGTWVWNNNGRTLSYTNWKTGEPNNAGANGENCLTVSSIDNFYWNDMPCANRYNFVCEASTAGNEIVG